MTDTNRRTFLQASSAAATLLATGASASTRRVEAAGDRKLRVALIGCGNRGRGAASQALSTAGDVELVAMADAFSDRLDSALTEITKHKGDRVNVPESRRFVGFDAYKQATDCMTDEGGVDVVILTTPPGFRPIHLEYAIDQGKHAFMEKPVAVDGPGIRRVLAATERAKSRELRIGVGLQRRHSVKYNETVRRLQDGAIGEINLLRAYWNSGGVWTNPRKPDQTEMEYQMRNWYYFNWLCGDHIVEQHIHNLDVCNWVKGGYPVEANGQGGRQVRTSLDHGEIFDHHMVEFTYADGSKLISQCRHIPGAWSSVSEHCQGSGGSANIGAGRIEGHGDSSYRFRGDDPNHYQVEHDVLFKAIREGLPHNEGEYGAMSTMTAILGRLATYSGKVIKMKDALASDIALVPEAYAFDANPPTLPDPDGHYAIPTPGRTQTV